VACVPAFVPAALHNPPSRLPTLARAVAILHMCCQPAQRCSRRPPAGLGGDAFLLYYEAASKKVHCLLGAGKAPAGLTLDVVRGAGISGPYIPQGSPLAVTVPGAAALWDTCCSRWGSLPLSQVLGAPHLETHLPASCQHITPAPRGQVPCRLHTHSASACRITPGVRPAGL
jgi:hypothetical protein